MTLIGLLAIAPSAIFTAASAVSVSLVPVKADKDVNERHPSASGDWTAWTSNSEARPDQPNAFLQQLGQARQRVNPRGTYGEAGGFDGTNFVWTQWSDRRAGNIYRINLDTGQRYRFGGVVNTPFGEFYPTISNGWLLFTRFSWDDNRYRVLLWRPGMFDAQVLATGTRLRPVYSGQVNGDWVTYTRVGRDQVSVYRYNLQTGTTLELPNSATHAYSAGVASDGTVYYLRSGDVCGRNVDLMRLPVDGTAEKVRDLPAGFDADRMYVDDREGGAREVHFQRVDCDRKPLRAWDTFKFVDSYTLDVATGGTGTGTVISTPAGIVCGSDCAGEFPRGTATVTLTAVSDPGSAVGAWSVDGCGSNAQCTVDVHANQTVTVDFELG